MRQILIIMCLWIVPSLLWAIGTPESVRKFYGGMVDLEKASDVNMANRIQQTMASCFMASDKSGIELTIDGLNTMPSTLYTMKLHTMIFREKSLKVSCNVINTELVEQPDQNGIEQKKGAQHYVSYIKKDYTRNDGTSSYNDLVFTLISNGLFVSMENTTEDRNSKTPRPSEDNERLSLEQLRAKAAYCYTKKDYVQAYEYYEQLVKVAPTDGDAAYRIALLTFWRKGCKVKYKKKKLAEEKAKEYIDVAIRYGSDEIREKAMNVRDNWNNDNVYF